jgi:cyclophilin family peptidyl-prolyl cis-trans isomerase
MSSSRRPGRRLPPKGRALRSDTTGSEPAGTEPVATERVGTRAQNRAAKRAVGGVRPKAGASRGGGNRRRGSNTGLIVLAVAAVAVVAAVLLIGNPFGTPAPSASPIPTVSGVVGDGTCPTSQPPPLAKGETRTVTIKTSKGDIVLKVDGSLSPIAAGNFVALVTCHFYDGSVFHRTAALQDGTPFVIQGGAPKPGTAPISYTIADEQVTATYKRGTLAMARSSLPNSQTSQFFIVLDDTAGPILVSNGNNYALFGEVISDMSVADAIFQASAGAELPTAPITMTAVTVAAGPASTASAAPTAAPTAAATTEPSAAPTTASSPAPSTAP